MHREACQWRDGVARHSPDAAQAGEGRRGRISRAPHRLPCAYTVTSWMSDPQWMRSAARTRGAAVWPTAALPMAFLSKLGLSASLTKLEPRL